MIRRVLSVLGFRREEETRRTFWMAVGAHVANATIKGGGRKW